MALYLFILADEDNIHLNSELNICYQTLNLQEGGAIIQLHTLPFIIQIIDKLDKFR